MHTASGATPKGGGSMNLITQVSVLLELLALVLLALVLFAARK